MSETYPVEIDVHEVKRLRDSEADLLLLDVRELDEYRTAAIEGSLLIPLSEFGARLDELEPHRGRRIVVHCHHGVRSMRVVAALRGRGFDTAQSMAGGIDIWSEVVDPAVPKY